MPEINILNEEPVIKNYAGLLTRLQAPMLMAEEKLRIITEAVTIPLLMQQAGLIDRAPAQSGATVAELTTQAIKENKQLAIIPVFDALVAKQVNAASGMTSYQRISAQIDQALQNGATDILFYLDTPGGEATGVFGLSSKIRELQARGVRTATFADNATSAGYAIASATNTIYSTEIAQLGSIAALQIHTNISKAADMKGHEYTILRSKPDKALGDPFSSLSEAALTKMTTTLAALDTIFNNEVALGRPVLSVENIIDMRGGSFMSEEAMKLKLTDKMVPNLEAAVSEFLSSKSKSQPKRKGAFMSEKTIEVQLAEANAEIATLKAAAITSASLAETKLQEAVAAETTRCASILKTATSLRLDSSVALGHIEKNRPADLSAEIMAELAEAKTPSIDATGLAETVKTEGSTDAADRATFLAAAYSKATGYPTK